MRKTQASQAALQAGLYKLGVLAFILLVLALLSLTACSPKTTTIREAAIAPTSVDSRPATLAECSNGGLVVTVGDQNNVICNGQNGSNGSNGSDGANGQNGTNGQDGQNGAPGANGTTFTIVQFCPGATVYPSTFPEVGIRVGNLVYGVYSANNGFLTLLPPGLYNSNAVGSSCNFTINADGTVSH